MKTLRLSQALAFCVALGSGGFLSGNPVAAEEQAQVANRIVLVGDSTVASRSGWGDAFAKLLAPGVECLNLGRGGRSSKSYRAEGHWKKVLAVKPGWVLIQFGHNDQPGKGPERETDAMTTFRENLARYVAETRAIGAKPVLVTSLTRRNFNAQEKIDPAHLESSTDNQGNRSPDYLNDYVEATRAVALEQKVPLIDLNARSIELMNHLGPERAAAAAFDRKTKSSQQPDKTHLSAHGAAETAKLIVDEIRNGVPELARCLSLGNRPRNAVTGQTKISDSTLENTDLQHTNGKPFLSKPPVSVDW
ncbi:MAG: rhamnogalacturonan acetylesterase [Verrucomicrobia bacterium]|nr:rhamnogalacturonan acetylesterase [Verrucomicrobiota bacterium]